MYANLIPDQPTKADTADYQTAVPPWCIYVIHTGSGGGGVLRHLNLAFHYLVDDLLLLVVVRGLLRCRRLHQVAVHIRLGRRRRVPHDRCSRVLVHVFVDERDSVWSHERRVRTGNLDRLRRVAAALVLGIVADLAVLLLRRCNGILLVGSQVVHRSRSLLARRATHRQSACVTTLSPSTAVVLSPKTQKFRVLVFTLRISTQCHWPQFIGPAGVASSNTAQNDLLCKQ